VFTREKAVALACAGALCVTAAQAAGAADPEGAAESHGHSPKVAVLDRQAERFHRAVEVHRERLREQARKRARERERAQAEAASAAATSTEDIAPEQYGVSQATLDSIAACESGSDPTAVSADGTYRGKYQFDYGTWASVGGSGDPAAAPEAEQDMRAAMLYAQAGSSPWPICR
jgi:soluble lytic murein transglycosylase-like protein